MSEFIRWLLPSDYVMRRYARNKVIGCVGGLIGLPLCCLFFAALSWLGEARDSAGASVPPWLLLALAAACVSVLLAVAGSLIAVVLGRRTRPP